MKINPIIPTAFNIQAQKEQPMNAEKQETVKPTGDYIISLSTQEQRDLDRTFKIYNDIAKIGLCNQLKMIVEDNSKLQAQLLQQQRKNQRY